MGKLRPARGRLAPTFSVSSWQSWGRSSSCSPAFFCSAYLFTSVSPSFFPPLPFLTTPTTFCFLVLLLQSSFLPNRSLRTVQVLVKDIAYHPSFLITLCSWNAAISRVKYGPYLAMCNTSGKACEGRPAFLDEAHTPKQRLEDFLGSGLWARCHYLEPAQRPLCGAAAHSLVLLGTQTKGWGIFWAPKKAWNLGNSNLQALSSSESNTLPSSVTTGPRRRALVLKLRNLSPTLMKQSVNAYPGFQGTFLHFAAEWSWTSLLTSLSSQFSHLCKGNHSTA